MHTSIINAMLPHLNESCVANINSRAAQQSWEGRIQNVDAATGYFEIPSSHSINGHPVTIDVVAANAEAITAHEAKIKAAESAADEELADELRDTIPAAEWIAA